MTTSDYIEIVPVRFNEDGKTYLFQTRAFKRLKKNCIVKVEGNADRFAKVAADSKSVKVGGDEYKWFIDVFGATEPLKRIAGVFMEIEYEDGVIPF